MRNNHSSNDKDHQQSLRQRREDHDRKLAMKIQLHEALEPQQLADVQHSVAAASHYVSDDNDESSYDGDDDSDYFDDDDDSINDDYRLAWKLQCQNFEDAFARGNGEAIAPVPETAAAAVTSTSAELPLQDEEPVKRDHAMALAYQNGTSTYAGAAAAAVTEEDLSSDDGGGKMPYSSFPAHAPTTTTNGTTKEAAAKKPTGNKLLRYRPWFDIMREKDGDPVFQQLLGNYGDTTPLNLTLPSSMDPRGLSMAAIQASRSSSSNNARGQLQQYCNRIGVQPVYQLVSQEGPDHDKVFESIVYLDADAVLGTGQGKTIKDSQTEAARQALHALSNQRHASGISTSLRGAATNLPFCIRFQFERYIFAVHDERMPLKWRRRPRGFSKQDLVQTKQMWIFQARKLLFCLLQVVLPPLIAVDWGEQEEQNGGKITLAELFADQLWDSLLPIRGAIAKGTVVMDFEREVELKLERAKQTLARAERLVGATEHELAGWNESKTSRLNGGDDGYLELVQKRALWPVAEYRCKFDWNGTLVPADYEVLNKDIVSTTSSFTRQPSTRRAMREAAWLVRDRFAKFSAVKFHPVFQANMVGWLKNRPRLCGREYDYLFDKGTGKPDLWLFSPTTNDSGERGVSRSDLLRELGCFDKVDSTKLGDRISLAFTQTVPIVQLEMDQIVAIDEITRGGYAFSDGCGVMGMDIAKNIQEVFNLPLLPGSVQIRIGGVKGMLSLNAEFPPDKIGVRPSMCKFPSNHKILEVKRVAKANYSKDNKLFSQVLLIMHDLKVPNRVLLDLQARACANMAMEHDREARERTGGDIDIAKAYDYVVDVVQHRKKENGESFAPHELDELKRTMKSALSRVNLRCSVALLQGVVDEFGVLDEGEVLVDNGQVQGPVLICRSPCNTPGDIQKAYAVSRRDIGPSRYLNNSLVFSAMGERPMQDMLSGGDLDGDEFYVIYETSLVGMMTPAQAHDFGSQKDNVTKKIDVSEYFSVPRAVSPPDLSAQLEVFQRYMALGDVVADSSDAWIRAADSEGPRSAIALEMADLCQRALDARKLAFDIDPESLEKMKNVLKRFDAPHWRSSGSAKVGRRSLRQSRSILGVLHDKWKSWISDLEGNKTSPSLGGLLPSGTSQETNGRGLFEHDADIVECIVCRAPADRECPHCTAVWFCCDECWHKHSNEARHARDDESSGEGFDPMLNPLEILMDVTFGRQPAISLELRSIDYRKIGRADLKSLVAMVVLEYRASLNRGIDEANGKGNDTPHAFDVFLMKASNFAQAGDLAICRPLPGSDGDLYWFNRHGDYSPLDDVKYDSRVASLSGTLRILESLIAVPAPGSLKRHAMGRDLLADVVDTSGIALDTPLIQSLNESQRKAVATVASSTFKSGFLAIQGPPGTGKTSTIVGIVSAVGSKAIVAAPSNAAVANLALKILSAENFGIRDVVVFGDNCDDSVSFLNPTHRRVRYQGFLRSYRGANDDDKAKLLRKFISWLRLDFNMTSIDDVAALCRLHGDDSAGQKFLASASVVLCTLNTAGSTSLRKAVHHKFELFLLDEASQCSEAEFYIATTFPGVRRVVVFGDPKQLPATVVDNRLRVMGYGESFLSHLLQFYPEKVHLLNIQYRMDPSILRFSNESFYSNRILSADCVCDRQPRVVAPFRLVDTSGIGDEMQDHFSSWYNDYEVIVVKAILCGDEDIRRLMKEGNSSYRTIVITPYQAQVYRLKKELRNIKSLRSWDVATVDSFQGQEGDIVVLSMVRTRRVGFIDDANRLNVSLTRARRVLRVVGSVDFFKSVGEGNSALKQLAMFAGKMHAIEAAKVRGSWAPPDWTTVTLWKVTMTPRFHHCLKGMGRMDKNVALNTLLAVAIPDQKRINEYPAAGPPRWQRSSLLKYGEKLQIVWVAKEYEWKGDAHASSHYVGMIEAHYCGTRRECLSFIQKQRLLPMNARNVEKDLRAIVPCKDEVAINSTDVNFSWQITNDLQDAVFQETINNLPEGLFALDPDQERVVTLSPPLLLESRSGTGKTNVLFQHAVSYSRALVYEARRVVKPTCFVTVSPKLLQELQRRYNDIPNLPEMGFYTLRNLLDLLLGIGGVTEMRVASACSFLEYVHSRKSHKKLDIEPNLVESEIGGVIVGSLRAAIEKNPLTRMQYLEEKRSNVPVDNDEGIDTRNRIYKEYESYRQWKLDKGIYDVGDIVLRLVGLIGTGLKHEIFQAAYLDEVQDFSYASIFLICSIAGKKELQWVAAGDTAQMISPGCSFTFSGMKDTLVSIREGVELRKVEQLKRNYRMTKGVLDVGNAILRLIKKYFPDAIEYAQPEVAMKDLGLKVVLCDWEKAFSKKVSFGVQQAIIYSSSHDSQGVADSISKWLGNHPFVLSSLDSKGLEFDSVVVAFDMERDAWNVNQNKKSIVSLRMLRELYVAITRAKRRVVILVTKRVSAMKTFFLETLNCDLEEPDEDATVLGLEFDQTSTASEWLEEGHKLFKDERYSLASSCFIAAGNFGWSGYAEGLRLERIGRSSEAKSTFRTAAGLFFEASECERCLDLMKKIAQIPPWDEIDNAMLDEALKQRPLYLPRGETVKFALFRGAWDTINVDDLKDDSCARHLANYRQDQRLIAIVSNCTEEQLRDMEQTVPNIVGDQYLDQNRFPEAAKLFLRGNDLVKAAATTATVIDNARVGSPDLPRVVDFWRDHVRTGGDIPNGAVQIRLLLSLFDSPIKAASENAEACMKHLGPQIVKLAVTTNRLPLEELHNFHRVTFQSEVLEALTSKYSKLEVVGWYHERNDFKEAVTYVADHLSHWTDEELLYSIIKKMALRLRDYKRELVRRSLFVEAADLCLSSECWDLDLAVELSDRSLGSIALAQKNMERLLLLWRSRRNDNRVKRVMSQQKASSSTALLMHLFDNPEDAGKRYGKKCMMAFGEDIVLRAVGKDNYQVLQLFDKKFARAAGHQNPYKPRDRVVAFGLINATSLNGRHGMVTSLTRNGRCAVTFDGDRSSKAIKPENLRLEEASSSNDTEDHSIPGLSPRRHQSNGPPPRGANNESDDSSAPHRSKQRSSSEDSSMPPLQDGSVSNSSPDDSGDSSGAPIMYGRGRNRYSESSSSYDNSDEPPGLLAPNNQSETSNTSDDDDIPPSQPGRHASDSDVSSSMPGLIGRIQPSQSGDNANLEDDSDSTNDIPALLRPRNSSSEDSMSSLEEARNNMPNTHPGHRRVAGGRRNRKKRGGKKPRGGGRR